ncbi:hypothetical protein [Mesorhizobium sp. WSM2239]|uniref:Uncharacterized protein n=2 Tax=unclassified Mesorhizobium TaxID=325217 RepID=A0AAU8D7M5_9HYPH
MDFVSWLLALIGIAGDRAMHRSDRRAEIAKLNAEVASEAGRALDIITAAMPRLTRRCAQVCGDSPEMCDSMVKVLNDQRDAALKIMAMAEDYKKQIANAKGLVDWDKTLHHFQEWRATASRMTPWVEDIVNRYDAILYDAGAR